MDRATLEKMLERNMGHVHQSWDLMPNTLRAEFLVMSSKLGEINVARTEADLPDDTAIKAQLALINAWLKTSPRHAAQLISFSLNTTGMICAGFFQADEVKKEEVDSAD